MNVMKIGSYEDIRDHLRVRLMDMKANKDKLENAVYEPVGCGYALVAYMELPDEVAKDGIFNVPKDLAEKLGFNPRRIMLDARLGSMASDFPKLTPMQEVLMWGETHNLLTGGEMPEGELMLVLTTEEGYLGASALFYTDMQKRIGEIVGGDYYVIPSSVHEVLIMPELGQMNPNDMAAMVKEINELQVAPDERLGNRVMHYRADLDKLQIAADMDRVKEKEMVRA